jgi:hypothetical protein
VAKRRGKDVEIVKEVFQRRAKAEEKMLHIKGQKNTIIRGSRHQRGPVNEIEVDITEDKLNKQETQGTLNYKETLGPEDNDILKGLPKKVIVLLPRI